MANMCSNHVTFTGTRANIEACRQYIKNMIALEKETKCGQLGPGTPETSTGWFFDTYFGEENGPKLITIGYESRWGDNAEEVRILAKHFQVDAEGDFEESSNDIYGCFVYTYADDKLKIYNVPEDLAMQLDEDEESGEVKFRGEWMNRYDALDILLAEEKNNSTTGAPIK